ncbi:peptidase, M50 family protein [Oceanicola granulosus HTCC2516]|uniref:Peptidase, M50 family protein n=1 Tax=Oceanicola granulosus (strain ATCC BAA-861 / DSM 15982 / KCTC 12143 / HTCC2516) TaxID=314256 RepID=Q2CHH0_OCEGH|nr:biotin/lipoyl-binding protein [Oceanicola granulosus]EAR52069.1 peptidase, M50 family protein [Oceanicola granulosus HTCC2516]
MAAGGSFHSDQWHRVAALRPRLRQHARIFRTHYRGQLWYVLQDRTSGRFHRFTPESYFVLSMFDGSRTLQEVWDTSCAELESDALSQNEVISLLGQLHGADVLMGDLPPDIDEMAERGRKMRRKKRVMSLMNPLAVRVPMFDPEGFLRVTAPLVRPVLSWFGLLVWVAVVAYGVALAVVNWEGLTTGIADRVLSAESLVLLLLAYPVVKALHELGHAYMIKRWGGEVHEIGLMFLVFMPVPYIDASDSLSFQSKWQRAAVAGAGIMVEAMLAAIAVMVWDGAESGLVRAFAFNVILIGGVSTLFFNGNPLLRFDGYYVLSDLIEIPNLGRRANQYLGYLAQRYLLGVEEPKNPATAPGEPAWFTFYAIAAFLYRLVIFSAIVLLVASRFFFVGVILAMWTVFLMFVLPMLKHLWFVLTAPQLRRRRGQAVARVGAALAVVAGLLFVQPVPFSTLAEGVTLVPGSATIRPDADGTVTGLAVEQGQEVAAGDVLLTLEDPMLDARVTLLEATAAELRERAATAAARDPNAARIAREELAAAEADLALALERRDALTVRAGAAGQVVLAQPRDLAGRFVRQGETLGYVTTFTDPLVRAVVPERDADLVLKETKRMELRFASRPEEVLAARIVREVPALSGTLPSRALATEGGGRVVLDPSSPSGARALGNLLHLEVGVAPGTAFETIGERVHVRFVHEPASLAGRLYRRLRQVFLDQFDM